jgi:hypothetical protein
MSQTAWPESSLAEFCHQQLLPTAFARLDRLDPDSAWRRAEFGWRAGSPSQGRRTCFQPWGFVDHAGSAHSWLSSFAGRLPASPAEFLDAVDRLAQLLGLEEALDVQRVPPHELFGAYLQFRQDSLFETFLAETRRSFASPAGEDLRALLVERFGETDDAVREWPLGRYPDPRELLARLQSAGFSNDEIAWSTVLGDERLPGRLLVAWRDRFGRLSTIVARDLHAPATAPGRQLLLPAGTRSRVFGLDVALQSSTRPSQSVVIAEGLLEVVYWQAQGLANVCSAGRPGAPLGSEFWLELRCAGVRQATLALRPGPGRAAREFEAIGQAAELRPAPTVWVLADESDALRASRIRASAADEAPRAHGFERAARHLLAQQPSLEGDDALLALLADAVAFDERVADPARQVDLDERFWPLLEDALRGRWPGLRRQHDAATSSLDHRRQIAAGWRRYGRLAADLQLLLASRDVPAVERALRAALACPPQAGFGGLEARSASTIPLAPLRAGPEPVEPAPPPPPPASLPARPLPPAPRVVPRTANPDDVRLRAYCLWEKNGCPEGREVYFWAMAERELRGEAAADPSLPA